jgi:hypothetical protein
MFKEEALATCQYAGGNQTGVVAMAAQWQAGPPPQSRVMMMMMVVAIAE